MEMINFPSDLMEQLYKVFSTRLCANSVGQIVADVMVNPPRPGDPSYAQYDKVTSIYHKFKFHSLDRTIILGSFFRDTLFL